MTTQFDIFSVIIASLVLIMTYSINSLIKDYINYYFPETDEGLAAKTYYTIILNFIISIVIVSIISYKKTITDFPVQIYSSLIN